MRLSNKNYSVLLLVFVTLHAWGQSNERAFFLNEMSMASSGSKIEVNDEGDTILVSSYGGTNVQLNTQLRQEKKYLGTPYFRNKWYKGTVQLKGGEPSEGIMAFNIVKNLLYYTPDNNTLAIEIKPESFALDNLIFYSFKDKYEGAGVFYYNIVVDGEPKLLRQYNGRYVQLRNKVDDTYGNAKVNEYEGKFFKEEDYYFVIQNQLVLVNKKKSFFRAMGPYQQKAQKLVSDEKLNLKQASDIIKLAQLLNQ